MEGVGRGRGLTNPAWMTTPGGLSNGNAKPTGNAKDWTEHVAADGRRYFHNKITKITTWEKPNELKSNDELAVSSNPWKEYISDTGRKYYHNTVTQKTSWEIPSDYKVPSDGASVSSPKAGDTHKASSPVSEKKDAVTAFKDLLTIAGVKHTWGWEMAQGQISTDPRYKALKSMGEKKQAFSEWCAQRRKQEDDEKRKKDKQIKEDYMIMLKGNKEINPKTTWRKAQSTIETDPRYTAVDERDRELMFEEFLYEMERKEREEASISRKAAMLRFKKFLESMPSVTAKTQWRKLKEQLTEDPIFAALDKLDSLTVFEDHMVDLDHRSEEEAAIEREKQKRESRKARDAFRELLAEKLESGDLTLKTKWKDFVRAVKEKEEERYSNMFITTGSTPHELYCDFLEDLEERLDKDKRTSREILKEVNFTVGVNTTFEEFHAALSPHERFPTIPRLHLKHLFNELFDKAVSKEHSNQKRKKKLVSAFKDMLKGIKEITPASSWVEARPLVFTQKEFEALDDEQEREKAFTEYTVRLAEKQKAKEEKGSEEKGSEEKGEDNQMEDEDDKKKRKKEHKSKSKKHRHREDKDKDRKKKRHSHSPSDDEVPSSKKIKKEEKDVHMDEKREEEAGSVENSRVKKEEGEGMKHEGEDRSKSEEVGGERSVAKSEEEDGGRFDKDRERGGDRDREARDRDRDRDRERGGDRDRDRGRDRDNRDRDRDRDRERDRDRNRDRNRDKDRDFSRRDDRYIKREEDEKNTREDRSRREEKRDERQEEDEEKGREEKGREEKGREEPEKRRDGKDEDGDFRKPTPPPPHPEVVEEKEEGEADDSPANTK